MSARTQASSGSLGPLEDGQSVAIIGGGPAGSACAIALLNLAQKMGRRIEVIIYEGKEFSGEIHHNQCVGVLSPPLEEILERDLQVSFPKHLVQQRVTTYVLHSDRQAIVLKGEGPPAYTVSRVRFDDYLLWQARARGAKVVRARVTDLEIFWDRVMVYAESESRSVDVVVAAFGLDDGSGQILQRATALYRSGSYRPPPCLHSIVTRIYPGEGDLAAFGGAIHAFLPAIKAIEFGAVTPKKDHLTINVAGEAVTAREMDLFLRLPQVRSVLPPDFDPATASLQYFKGHFPTGVARGLCYDRCVVVGDAAGLLRSFKGKGVTYACLTGLWAAHTILREGFSREALRNNYLPRCQEILDDIPYGHLMRWLAIQGAAYGLLDMVIELARHDPGLQRALFDSVSANRLYKEIVHQAATPQRLLRLGLGALLTLIGLPRLVASGNQEDSVNTTAAISNSN